MLEAESQLEDGVVFDMNAVGFYFQATPRRGLSMQFFAKLGDQIDFANTRLADRVFLEPSFSWNISRSLLARVNSVFVKLDTKEGEKIFDARVIDARLTWQFSVRSFLRLTIQHSEVDRNLSAYDADIVDDYDAKSKNVGRQLLYSYKINPQTVFFLGYSDQYVDEDDLDGLTASDRSLFMKIGYAWNL